MSAWRTIDTAPRDGRYVLLFIPKEEEPQRQVVKGWFDYEWNGPGWAYNDFGDWCRPDKPTHWQPLPRPPRRPKA